MTVEAVALVLIIVVVIGFAANEAWKCHKIGREIDDLYRQLETYERTGKWED